MYKGHTLFRKNAGSWLKLSTITNSIRIEEFSADIKWKQNKEWVTTKQQTIKTHHTMVLESPLTASSSSILLDMTNDGPSVIFYTGLSIFIDFLCFNLIHWHYSSCCV